MILSYVRFFIVVFSVAFLGLISFVIYRFLSSWSKVCCLYYYPIVSQIYLFFFSARAMDLRSKERDLLIMTGWLVPPLILAFVKGKRRLPLSTKHSDSGTSLSFYFNYIFV